MSLILVRHGETPLNVTRVLQPADTPLSTNGLAQARALACRLAGMQAGGILSSDLPRALQTAEAIAQATGLPHSTTPLLQERNFGELRGKPYDSLGFNPLAMDEAPPGGESTATFAARVKQAFDHALSLRAALDGDLIVVTHGLVIRVLLEQHAKVEEAIELPRIGNTSITIVSAQPPHTVTLLDCTRHLDCEEEAKNIGHDPNSLSGG